MKTRNILLSVVLIAIAGFGLWPLHKMAQEKEVINNRLLIQKQQQIERLTELENREKITETTIAIPNTPQQIELVNDLNRIAKTTGLTIPDSWSFSVGHNSDVNAEQLSVGFPLSGSRNQIQKFLKEVEENSRFMGINNISFTTDSAQSIPLTKLSVQVYAFFLEA
jgi:Tfp pilus assembly protein PilO